LEPIDPDSVLSHGLVRHSAGNGLPNLEGIHISGQSIMPPRSDTSPSRAKRGELPTSSVPASNDIGENSASELVESPLAPDHSPLDPHDFADGGGSGGAEAFRRSRMKRNPQAR
jgi:hypothetical protein